MPEEYAAMSESAEPACCTKTRAGWERRIRLYYSSFPVIKDVPCPGCRRILQIRVYDESSVAE